MRIGLLASELSSLHLSTQRGAWLNAGANWRLFQLVASLFILLFTTSSMASVVVGWTTHKLGPRPGNDLAPRRAVPHHGRSGERIKTPSSPSRALQIQLVERIPFDQAVYLVLTTLTTVGFGGGTGRELEGEGGVGPCMGGVPVTLAALTNPGMARRWHGARPRLPHGSLNHAPERLRRRPSLHSLRDRCRGHDGARALRHPAHDLRRRGHYPRSGSAALQ